MRQDLPETFPNAFENHVAVEAATDRLQLLHFPIRASPVAYIDQHAVRIRHVKLAQRTFSK